MSWLEAAQVTISKERFVFRPPRNVHLALTICGPCSVHDHLLCRRRIYSFGPDEDCVLICACLSEPCARRWG